MNRKLALAIGYIAAVDAMPILQKVQATHQNLEDNRVFLNIVRDKLNAVCCRFEGENYCELHEEVYLPLFDALSYLTFSLYMKPVSANHVEMCLQTLQALKAHCSISTHMLDCGQDGAA